MDINLTKVIRFNVLKTALISVVLLLAACSEELPLEQQLRQTLKDMALSSEQQHIGDLMLNVSAQYADTQGRNKRDIKRIAQLYMLRNKNLHIFKHITQLEIDQERAEAIVLVAVSGQPVDSVESLKNIRAELMKFKVSFEYNERWQVTSAIWSRAGMSDFL